MSAGSCARRDGGAVVADPAPALFIRRVVGQLGGRGPGLHPACSEQHLSTPEGVKPATRAGDPAKGNWAVGFHPVIPKRAVLGAIQSTFATAEAQTGRSTLRTCPVENAAALGEAARAALGVPLGSSAVEECRGATPTCRRTSLRAEAGSSPPHAGGGRARLCQHSGVASAWLCQDWPLHPDPPAGSVCPWAFPNNGRDFKEWKTPPEPGLTLPAPSGE